MPKCKACGSNFTDKSKHEYQTAPAWNGECPACTKKKFANYLTEYLLRIMSVKELVQLVKEYFGNDRPAGLKEDDPVNKVTFAIMEFVVARNGGKDAKPPATAGHAIAAFVKHFDLEIKQYLRGGTDEKARKFVILAIIIGIILVIGAIILFVFIHGVAF